MSKKSYQLQKVTLTLFEGDFAFLQSTYPDVGGSAIVRELVRNHRAEIEARLTQPQGAASHLVSEVLSGNRSGDT